MDVREARRLLSQARVVQDDIRIQGLVLPAGEPADLTALVTDPGLRHATLSLFQDGHYARAVEEGMKYVAEQVRRRTGITLDGTQLMEAAFNPKTPLLQLNKMKTQSDQDEQKGFMFVFMGSVLAIRNPRSHRQGYTDAPEPALELLVWANHLVRLVLKAQSRRRTT